MLNFKQSILCFLLLSLCAKSSVNGYHYELNEEEWDREGENCQLKRMQTNITYPGCDPLTTKVNYCTGSCFSYVIHSPESPYILEEFRCCAGQSLHIKKRKLKFLNCIDEETGVVNTNPNGTQKTVYFPYINKCICTDPYRLLDG